MANNFLKTYGIKFRARQASKSPETATKDLNFAKLAQLAKCNKDVAKTDLYASPTLTTQNISFSSLIGTISKDTSTY